MEELIRLKVAAEIIPPERGKVYLEGRDLLRMSERRLLEFRSQNGFVFQDAALWENRSIFDNLALPVQLHHRRLTRDELQGRIHSALEQMDMGDSTYKYS